MHINAQGLMDAAVAAQALESAQRDRQQVEAAEEAARIASSTVDDEHAFVFAPGMSACGVGHQRGCTVIVNTTLLRIHTAINHTHEHLHTTLLHIHIPHVCVPSITHTSPTHSPHWKAVVC